MRKVWRRRHEKYYKNSRFHLVADIIFVSLIILLIATFIIIKSWQPHQLIDFSFRATNSRVVSGGVTEFVLDYQAHTRLSAGTLEIILPDNFKLISLEPATAFETSTNSLKLPSLKKGERCEIIIDGQVIGALNSQAKHLQLPLFYGHHPQPRS